MVSMLPEPRQVQPCLCIAIGHYFPPQPLPSALRVDANYEVLQIQIAIGYAILRPEDPVQKYFQVPPEDSDISCCFVRLMVWFSIKKSAIVQRTGDSIGHETLHIYLAC